MTNCNLDLCLAQPAAISAEQLTKEIVYNNDAIPMQKDAAPGYQNRLTIFYNGNVCVCDVTQFQAKAIISQTKKEIHDMTIRKTEYNLLQLLEANSSNSTFQSLSSSPSPSSSCFTSGVPMRKSLEQFLRKRKNRISAAAAPYQYRKSHNNIE